MPGPPNLRLLSPRRAPPVDLAQVAHFTQVGQFTQVGLIGLIALLALAPAIALATTADDLCAPSADPCNVTALVNVTDGSVIDVGERALRVLGRLDAKSGAMTIKAGRLDVLTGGELRARGDSSATGGTITVNAGTVQISGAIDVSGTPGGDVEITGSGDVNIIGSIEADSLGAEESGGSINLAGADVTVTGPMTAVGGRDRSGGDIGIRAAGSVAISAAIDATGGAGGSADLTAGTAASGGDLLILEAGVVLADASSSGEDGGQIDLTTNLAGTIDVRGKLSAVGRGSVDGAGDGGSIGLDAAGDAVLAVTGMLIANGGSPDGTGGESDLFSGGALRILGNIELRGLGSEADGGDLTGDADADVEIAGSVDVRGAGGIGGSVDIDAGGNLTVRTAGEIDVSTSASGTGGSLSLQSDAVLTVVGTLTADGGSSSGSHGGSVSFDGCEVDVQASAVLSSQRSGGSNLLTGRDAMLIGGTLRADAASGRNQLRYPGPEEQPVILGSANISPAPLLSPDSTIARCQTTPGATRTPTPTGGTPTPTATPTPGCVGDCNGDGIVGIDELIRAVSAALGVASANCNVDRNGDGEVTIDEVVAAVAASIGGCA